MMNRPGFRRDKWTSGTEKSSLMDAVSSRVVITVPGSTRLPTLTRRKPSLPLNGALMMVSSRCASAAVTAARSASRWASSCCSWDSATAWVLNSCCSRRYWLSVSTSVALAAASSASGWAFSSSARTVPTSTF